MHENGRAVWLRSDPGGDDCDNCGRSLRLCLKQLLMRIDTFLRMDALAKLLGQRLRRSTVKSEESVYDSILQSDLTSTTSSSVQSRWRRLNACSV